MQRPAFSWMHFPVCGECISTCRSPRCGLRNNMRVAFVPILILIIQAVAMSETQSPNVIGIWNVEITFANNEHRAVRLRLELMAKVVGHCGPAIQGLGWVQVFRSTMESRRSRLDNVLWRRGVLDRQRGARRGNVNVHRQIRNSRFDHRRGRLFPASRRTSVEGGSFKASRAAK